MTRENRETIADWLMVLGATGLFASLFLTWSHQFSAAFLAKWGSSGVLAGVPHDPTAWQVYSVSDVLLALLATALVAVALAGNRRARLGMLPAVVIGLAVVWHALGDPPTNGASVYAPNLSSLGYFPDSPSAGAGEIVAIAGLGLMLVGLVLSFTAD